MDLTASLPGYEPARVAVEATHVARGEAPPVVLSPERRGTLVVRVLDETGRGLPGAEVELSGPPLPAHTGLSRSRGRGRLIPVTRPGGAGRRGRGRASANHATA